MISPRYAGNAESILAFLRERFEQSDRAERARWRKGLSDRFGYTAFQIAEGTGLTVRRVRAILPQLVAENHVRVSDDMRLPSATSLGVAGGGQGNFYPRRVPSEYRTVTYRSTL